MLRAVASIYVDSQTIARKDVFKVFRVFAHSNAAGSEKTVLSYDTIKQTPESKSVVGGTGSTDGSNVTLQPPPPSPPPRPQRLWSALAALAVTASLGGIYLYRKHNDDGVDKIQLTKEKTHEKVKEKKKNICIPPLAVDLPSHVQYLLVGAGTASFAAMRAIRSARPDAHVLLVGEEPAPPYMRPPLSKELWREPDLAERADRPDDLSFRQWNGRRRSLLYEPNAFYTAADKLRDGVAGAGVARGWRVTSIDPASHTALLAAVGEDGETHTLTYDKCLIATGVRARRVAALRAAAQAGRALPLRSVRDAAHLAAAVDDPAARVVAVVGGGFLASELSAALADRLRADGKRVMQVFRESAPLEGVLPHYLAAEAARRLEEAGVTLVPEAEVVESSVEGGADGVVLRLSSGAELRAHVVAECAGSEPAAELAAASGLELHPALGGVLVDAELRARSDVFAAGDVACFYDVALGRRRVEHHDHAVLSGRLAGENMAAVAPPKHYRHQSMFWSDLGPQLGYEAIGIIDSRLSTVGVFSAEAVGEQETEVRSRGVSIALAEGGVTEGAEVDNKKSVEVDNKKSVEVDIKKSAEIDIMNSVEVTEGDVLKTAEVGKGGVSADTREGEVPRRYERGVVFYLRENRVVGVLLWNLFNRMHVARQVLAQGEFDDLFEVAKLFSLNEEE